MAEDVKVAGGKKAEGKTSDWTAEEARQEDRDKLTTLTVPFWTSMTGQRTDSVIDDMRPPMRVGRQLNRIESNNVFHLEPVL